MDGSDIGTQSGLRIGRVIAVSASQAVALLERCDDSGGTDRPWPVEMGALVKMHTRVSTVYGMVSGMRVPLPNLAPSDPLWLLIVAPPSSLCLKLAFVADPNRKRIPYEN